MEDFYFNRGIYYAAIGWTLTVIALVVVATRLYSRCVLTRSAGSDDFTIAISAVSNRNVVLCHHCMLTELSV